MKFLKRQLSLAVAGVLLCGARAAYGIVLYGTDDGATNNLAAPANGAPWQYVARIDDNNASGVYLGNGFVITANHVTGPLATASINGSIYAIDQSYTPLQIGGADIKLLRIIGDPLLSPLPLNGANNDDTGQDCTIIGWGAGKGTEVSNQGWNWGDDSTRAERWGFNTTGSVYISSDGLPYVYADFNRPGAFGIGSFGEDEASPAIGDSGGGLFIKYGNTWKLVGIVSSVSTPNQTLYDTDPSDLFDTPTRAFYTPVKSYRSEISAAIPEPATTSGLLAGLSVLFPLRQRRRRRMA